MIKCSYRFDYYLIHVLNELLWACNNDCVMFVHYMSFDMRINNKYLLNWTELFHLYLILITYDFGKLILK